MNAVYHWTDLESAQAILDAFTWEGGSATTNPAYRFNKGVNETMIALAFDGTDFIPREAPTVPWQEWEVIHESDIDLLDAKFLGFFARTKRDAARLKRIIVNTVGDEFLFPVKILRTL